jgi:O-antigen/teichoic acid export membrane protein
MTSERIALGRHSEAHRVFKLSFILMLGLGVAASSIFFFGAEFIVNALKNPGAYYAMISIAPALLFVPIMAVYRGYFQGMQQMEPTAVSQLTEQAVRVAIGLTLAAMLIPRGIEYAAAGATIGTSIGPIAGVIILVIIYYIRRRKLHLEIEKSQAEVKESAGKIIGTLAAIAIPITIGVSLVPIMNIVDVIVVMRRLQGIDHPTMLGGLYILMEQAPTLSSQVLSLSPGRPVCSSSMPAGTVMTYSPRSQTSFAWMPGCRHILPIGEAPASLLPDQRRCVNSCIPASSAEALFWTPSGSIG